VTIALYKLTRTVYHTVSYTAKKLEKLGKIKKSVKNHGLQNKCTVRFDLNAQNVGIVGKYSWLFNKDRK